LPEPAANHRTDPAHSAKRKELTQRAEQVVARIKELHRSIVDHLAKAPAL